MNLKLFRIILINIIIITFINSNLIAKNEWFIKGKNAFQNKDYKNAIELFTKSLNNNNPNISEKLNYYYRAMSYLYLQNIENAINDLNTIITLDSTFPDAYNSRGLCYGYWGEINKAIFDFKKAIKLDSSFSQAFINLGSAYMAKKEYDSAEKMFDIVIRLDSTNPENYYLRANLFYLSGEYEKAIEDFTNSINNGIKNKQNYYSRANAFYRLEKYLDAIKDYSKVVELDSNYIDALNNRAVSYMKLGLTQKADEDRLKIAVISAGIENTPDINAIRFKKYLFLDGRITIQLPTNWFSVSDTTTFGKIKVIAKDTVRNINDRYLVGVRISLDSNMAGQFNVNNKDEILKFWEKSTKINTKSYYQYSVIYQKEYKIADFSGFIETVRVLTSKDAFPIRYYELVLVKNDILFYVYMQSPEIQFAYYKQIFDKAIKSIQIKY